MPYILKGAGHTWTAPDISTDEAKHGLAQRFEDWKANRARARASYENAYLNPTAQPKHSDVYPGPSRAEMARMNWASYYEQV